MGMAGDLKEFNFEEETTTKISQKRIDDIEEQIGAFFKAQTKKDIQKEALKRGLRLFMISSAGEVLESEHLRERNFWENAVYPQAHSAVPHPAYLFKSTENSSAIPCRAPMVGEHNQEIYVDELGFSREDLMAMSEAGAI